LTKTRFTIIVLVESLPSPANAKSFGWSVPEEKMTVKRIALFCLLTFVFILSGCGPSEEEIKATEEADATRVYSTAAALMTGAADEATETPTATLTETVTLTPEVEETVEQGPTNTSEPVKPCNLIGFISDVTIPDGTEFAAGESFTKTWRLRNDGTCTWDSAYSLIFASGDQLSGVDSKQLTDGTVTPGETIDVSVDLVAPDGAETYTGYWLLQAGDGGSFGLDRAGSAFYVQIVVVEDEVTEEPTAEETEEAPEETPTATATTETAPEETEETEETD